MAIEERLKTSGERLRRARILAGLNTRREFEQRYKISSNTLQGWEQGKNPLSRKGAQRVVEALKHEGLLCSTDWLLEGTGMPPRPFEAIQAGVKDGYIEGSPLAELNLREEEAIYKESQLFKELNPNAIILTIADDAMEPFFAVGDHIGGVQLFNDDIKKYIGTICILELENNLIVPRYLHEGTREGTYTASCTNAKTKAAPLNIYNAKVISAAPILWHRRKISSL